MALGLRLRRIAPFVALGLVVPVLWSLIVVGLPDDRLATVEDRLVVETLPGPEVRRFSDDEPVLNITVRAIDQAPVGSQVQTGDTLEVVLPPEATGRDDVLTSDEPLSLALVPAERLGGPNGSATWEGYRLTDAKAGWTWALQDRALLGALVLTLPSVGGALLVGYALGLPRSVRQPIADIDAPPAVAGLLLGVFLGGVMATGGTGTNTILPRVSAGVPLPGALGFALLAMAAVGALWKRPLVMPNGGRTATVGGLALLVSIPVALLFLWQGRLATDRLLLDEIQLTAAVGAIAVLTVAGTRWLRLRWARLAAGLLVLIPPGFLLVTSPIFLAVSLPVAIVGLAGARDLFGPALVASKG